MNRTRIDECFARLRAEGRKALVAYLCVGDPSLEESTDLAMVAAQAGADILELGVPFSDPVADGPVIAEASQRAICAGSSLRQVIAAAARVRAATEVPIVLFTYFNPILAAGVDATIQAAAAAGIDALLLVDLPPEEGSDLRARAREVGVGIIPLLTPTTSPQRATQAMAGAAGGFLYYVSVTGVTGAASAPLEAASQAAATLREQGGLPVVIGFGIDGPAKAKAAAGPPGTGADGVVIGTALVRGIHEAPDAVSRRAFVQSFLGDVRAALDSLALPKG